MSATAIIHRETLPDGRKVEVVATGFHKGDDPNAVYVIRSREWSVGGLVARLCRDGGYVVDGDVASGFLTARFA